MAAFDGYFCLFLDPATLDTSFTWKQCVLGTDLLSSNYRTFLESLNKKSSSNENLT